MGNLRFVRGDATAPQGDGNKIIAHICNDIGRWGAGFVLALSQRWKQPEADFHAWYRDRETNGFGLGKIRLVQVDDALWVANMIGQHGIQGRTRAKVPPIRYEAIESCLTSLAEHALRLDAAVHMPRIGCGLAGGKWEQIEPIVKRTLVSRGISVTVYDL